jgi:WhiB family redox-sensing transcriptional regulator
MTTTWMKQAACRGIDPSLFYAERDEDTQHTNSGARQVCRTCPVRMECLLMAYENREEFGVWGGVTPGERRPHRFQQTLEMVRNEIEYLRILDMEPRNRRSALKKMRAKK